MRRRQISVALVVILTALGTTTASAAVGGSNEIQVSISGRITSDTGTGVAGMCIQVGYYEKYLVNFAQAPSRSDGSYRVTFQQTKNSTGEYHVQAAAKCGADGHWQAALYPNMVDVTATPGQSNVSGIDMTTRPGGRITGRVTNLVSGKGVAGLFIYGYSQGESGWIDYAWTRSDGTFVLGGYPDGDYVLWLNPIISGAPPLTREYLSQFAPAQPDSSTATRYPVTVGQDTVADVAVAPSDTIAGQVTEPRTHRPLRSVEVEVTSEDGAWHTSRAVRTNKDGYYIANGLGPGSYQVCFKDGGLAHSDRCYRNVKPGDAPTLVTVTGFGVTIHGINQTLPIGPNR